MIFVFLFLTYVTMYDFPGGSDGKVSAYNVETQVQSLCQEDLLEKKMANHTNILS